MDIDKKFLVKVSIAEIQSSRGDITDYRNCSVITDALNLYFDLRSVCYQKLIASEPKKRRKFRGLGDVVEVLAESTGIKKVVENIEKKTGKDCGCPRRRDFLNKKFPI